MSDLVRNPEDWFSHVTAHLSMLHGQDSNIGSLSTCTVYRPVEIALCCQRMCNTHEDTNYDQ